MLPVIITVVAPRLPGHLVGRPGARRPGEADSCAAVSAAGQRATVTRRLSTIAGLYRYAVEENLLDHSSAAHVRRPRLDCESHATGLDRNEVGALLVAAGLGTVAWHAPISLLALNGPRMSEATGADIEALGTERGPPDHGGYPQGRQESRRPARAADRPASPFSPLTSLVVA